MDEEIVLPKNKMYVIMSPIDEDQFNIICVDKESSLQRYIATTMPVRKNATGSVPLIGWLDKYDFALAKADQLLVENNPAEGFSLTANNDTMGEDGEFYIHNFPTHNSRA